MLKHLKTYHDPLWEGLNWHQAFKRDLRSFKRAKEKLNLIWSIPTPVPIAWNGIDVHGGTKNSAMKRKIRRKMEDRSCDNEVRSSLFVAVSPRTIETLYGWPMPWLEGLAPLGARREAPPSLTSQTPRSFLAGAHSDPSEHFEMELYFYEGKCGCKYSPKRQN